MVDGMLERAAGALKQIGARSLGFQKSGSSFPALHDRCTMHTKPFLPFTAVSKPLRLSTMISASSEMDLGAALRASAISASRSAIRYCSSGAMLGYFASCDLVSCALACNVAPSTTAKVTSVSTVNLFRIIDLLFRDPN